MQNSQNSRFVSRLTRESLALILAGGRGSRLKHLTTWRAKPAVPFGGKFRIVDFPLSNCVNSGIRRVGVITQYKAHSLIRHIQKGWGFLRGEFGEFVELLPAQQRIDEQSWYRGTADAVYQNLDIIRSHEPSYVVILAGDHIYKMDYGQMIAHHVEAAADLTVGCIEVPIEQSKAFGVMSVDRNGRITEFAEKPENPKPSPNDPDMALASMGIYVFNTRFLYECLIYDADDPGSNHDFGQNIIPRAIGHYRVIAHPFKGTGGDKGYWRDVGTVDAFWEANIELIGITPELNLYDRDWPIWTYQEQLPPAKFIFDDDGRRGMAIDSMVSGGCIISGSQLKRSLVFSNVRIDDESVVKDTVILPDATIGAGCRITKAVVDRGCKIPPGTIIGEDPKADAERFHVSENGVVLVVPEMFGQELHHVR